MQEKLPESEMFYKTILDGIINGVWVTNKDDVIFYTNKGMENIAGVQADQIVNTRVLKDFPESTLNYFRNYYLKAKDTLKPVYYDAVPVVTHVGRQSYQSGWLIPRIKEGKYDGIICTVDDVTERKEAEEKLKEFEEKFRKLSNELEQKIFERTKELDESEEKYRLIVENSQEGIWAIDVDANTTYVNERMAEMLGYTVDEMLGKHLFDFMDENGIDGSKIYTSLGTSPIIDKDGNYLGAFAFVSDITDRKRAKEELLKEKRFTETALNAQRDTFFSF